MSGRYLAVPVKTRDGRQAGWFVYQLPIGNHNRAVARFSGPLAGRRAKRRARKLGRSAR